MWLAFWRRAARAGRVQVARPGHPRGAGSTGQWGRPVRVGLDDADQRARPARRDGGRRGPTTTTGPGVVKSVPGRVALLVLVLMEVLRLDPGRVGHDDMAGRGGGGRGGGLRVLRGVVAQRRRRYRRRRVIVALTVVYVSLVASQILISVLLLLLMMLMMWLCRMLCVMLWM